MIVHIILHAPPACATHHTEEIGESGMMLRWFHDQKGPTELQSFPTSLSLSISLSILRSLALLITSTLSLDAVKASGRHHFSIAYLSIHFAKGRTVCAQGVEHSAQGL
jgi:hypothetical protein